jgi:pyridoxal 5'-phosphate synthase pdxS subunit
MNLIKLRKPKKMIDERQSIHGLDVKTLDLRMQDRGGAA